jgi:hypothetical protein
VPLGKAGEYPVRSCCSRGIRRRTVFRSPGGKRSTRPYESSNERESAWRARKGRRRHQARSRGIRRRERSEDPREKGQALGRSTRKEKELQGPEAKTTRKREIVTYGPNHARKRSCSGVGAARSSRSPSTQEGTIRGTIVNHARKRVRARKEHERGKGTPPPRRNVRKPSFASRGLNEGAWFSCATAWSFVGCVGKDRYNGFDRLVRNSRSCFPGRSVSLPGSGTKARSPVSRFMSSTVCAS